MNMNIMNNMFGKKRIPVKVTNIKRSRKIGIIISDFDDLKKKANEYLCVTNPDDWKSLRVFLEDQTEITSLEYLLSVSSHLLIVSLEPTSTVSQGKFFLFFHYMLKQNDQLRLILSKHRFSSRGNGKLSQSCTGPSEISG